MSRKSSNTSWMRRLPLLVALMAAVLCFTAVVAAGTAAPVCLADHRDLHGAVRQDRL